MSEQKSLKTVIVGCRMGQGHAKALYELKEFDLAALCDLDTGIAKDLAEKTGNPAVYSDYKAMLDEVKPDVVVIATPNNLHAPMTLQAIETGVKGVYCEKPMATCMADARAMVEACAKKGIPLVVGHQRRMSPVYRTMRRFIEEGAIGDVYLIRATCAGDFLSDGTHSVDSVLHLMGDEDVNWVFGQICRKEAASPEELAKNPWAFKGHRYGHVTESGAMTTFEFKSGVRAEILTGEMWFPNRKYQDIEVFGTKGRLWRAGDQANPPLLISDDQAGGWRAVEFEDQPGMDVFKHVYSEFAKMIQEGASHPLSGENSLRSFEIVMSVYESARLRAKITLPLKQERFPLDIMVEKGEL